MRKTIGGLLKETDLRYWGIGFILVLFAIFSLALDLPGNGATQAAVQNENPHRIFPAVFRFQEATPTEAEQPAATPTRTPLPAELLANYKQTTGIIIFAGVIVLIIVGGVFFQLLQDRNSSA